jgi:hypothetical protein
MDRRGAFAAASLAIAALTSCKPSTTSTATAASSLALISTEPPGPNCPTGGARIDSGVDLNHDGTLSPNEITQTHYACSGAGGTAGTSGADGTAAAATLVAVLAEPAGAHCALGGEKIEAGVDANGNGALDANEVSATSYVCNGAAATANGYNSLIAVANEPAGVNCALGGKKIEEGADLNGNGVLDAGEVSAASYVCNGDVGVNGNNALINITDLAAGAICAAGGKSVAVGVDANDNGALDVGEVAASTSVCNGDVGAAGKNGLITITHEPAGANCAAGGDKIMEGVDANGNDSLDAGEVAATSYVCNGAAGTAGNNSLIAMVDEAPGANCTSGGKKVTTGVDANDNGTLDSGEVAATAYVCDGAAGANGKNSLIAMVDEAPGANCAAGGKKLTAGVDANDNGVLDAGEIAATTYICNGAAGASGENSLIAMVDEAPGANCAAGGKKLTAGVDANDSGVLDAGEIAATAYICNGAVGAIGENSLITMVTEAPGVNCAAGGTKVMVGVDANHNNGLDAGEVAATSYVCGGAAGANGENSLIAMVDEAPGANCAAGGKKMTDGVDANGNGALDASEVAATAYICNGAVGATGKNSLITMVTEAPGANCAAGGKKLLVGVDANANTTLDPGEIVATSYVCDGAAGASGKLSLFAMTGEAPGSHCVFGGEKVMSGVDANGNATLDAGEVMATAYVCNGANGSNARNSLIAMNDEAAGANCAMGGKKLTAGVDANDNGTLDAGEILATSYVCGGATGAAGSSSLIAITSEPAGSNCAAGGEKLTVGVDNNDNGMLDLSEIAATSYACNGPAGASGNDALITIVDEAPGSNCAAGGKKVTAGVDANDNGTLDAAEVSATSYVCNGAAGSNGASSLIAITDEPSGSNCASGGKKVTAGTDLNANGALDPSEVSATTFVCNGVAGAAADDSLILATPESAGSNCATGGEKFQTGQDTNADGTLQISEVTSTSYVCNGPCSASAYFNGTACVACSPACTPGQYQVTACTATTNLTCASCDPSCLTCDGATNDDCTSCGAPYVLIP